MEPSMINALERAARESTKAACKSIEGKCYIYEGCIGKVIMPTYDRKTSTYKVTFNCVQLKEDGIVDGPACGISKVYDPVKFVAGALEVSPGVYYEVREIIRRAHKQIDDYIKDIVLRYTSNY